MSVTTLTLALLGAYLVSLKIVSYFAHRSSIQTVEDFFVMGRTVSTPLLVGTVFATVVNTLAVSGVPALVHKGGVLFSQMFFIGIIVPVMIYYFGPKIWQRGQEKKFITQAELFGSHYDSKAVSLITAVLGFLAIFPFMAIQLSAVGKVFVVSTSGSIAYETAVLICAASIGVYLYLGGSRAVVWTDMLQGVCFSLVIVVSAVLFWQWGGGYQSALVQIRQKAPQLLTFNDSNFPLFVDNVLSWPFAFFLWPQVFKRMFMAKSAEVIRQSAPISFLVFNLIVVCTMTMGIMGTAHFYGELADPDQLVAAMYKSFFPIGGAFIVLAVFATGMSTVDSILLASSSIVKRDILPLLVNSSSSEVEEFKKARLIAVVFLVLVTLFALSETGRGAIVPLVTLGASIATLFLWPLIGCFCWKGATKEGVLVAMCLGFVVIALKEFTDVLAFLPYGAGFAGFTTGAGSFLVVSIATRRFKTPK